MGFKTWIYHKTEEPKIIDNDDMESYKKDGWRDSPACFIDVKDFGIDPDDSEKVQALGDMVQGVADSMNGALNLETMTKPELEEYALDHFGKDINPKNTKRIKTLLRDVQQLVSGTNGNC